MPKRAAAARVVVIRAVKVARIRAEKYNRRSQGATDATVLTADLLPVRNLLRLQPREVSLRRARKLDVARPRLHLKLILQQFVVLFELLHCRALPPNDGLRLLSVGPSVVLHVAVLPLCPTRAGRSAATGACERCFC